MARPTITEKLTADEVVELVLPDSTVLVLSYEGMGLQGVSDGPPTKNSVSVGGRSYAMRYDRDATGTWAPTATVGWASSDVPSLPDGAGGEKRSLDTGLLWRYAGHKCTFRRYPFGKISGAESRVGDFWMVPTKARNGNKMMIAISGQPAGDLAIGTV